jgi:general secretion pathway protein G
VVIVVIAILASLVAPNIFQNVGAAKDATARSQIEMLGAALDAYRLDNGKYPPTSLGLDALNTKPSDESASTWRGPYLRKTVPLDPWHHPTSTRRRVRLTRAVTTSSRMAQTASRVAKAKTPIS